MLVCLFLVVLSGNFVNFILLHTILADCDIFCVVARGGGIICVECTVASCLLFLRFC